MGVTFFMWTKAKKALGIFALAFMGGLLVLLKLKTSELHAAQMQALKSKFSGEDQKEDEEVEAARKEFEDAKDDLDSLPK
jgi:cell division protein ZapA (FtsZ GTPase activity inhibitor)